MANEQEAGAIIIALKAQIDSMEKGFAKAKQTLAAFGKDTQAAAVGVEKAGTTMSAAFDRIDVRSARLAARFAAMSSRMLSLQLAISGLREIAGGSFGSLQKAADAAGAGLSTFAATVSLVPSKLGIMAGALGGASIALAKFFAPTKEAIQASNDAAVLTENVDDLLNTMQRLNKEGNTLAGVFGESALDKSARSLKESKTAAEQLLAAQTKLIDKRKEITALLRHAEGQSLLGFPTASGEAAAFRNQIAAIDRFLDNVPKKLEDIKRGLPEQRMLEVIEGSRSAIQGINQALEDTGKITQRNLDLGLIGSLEGAEQSARAAEKALADLIAEAVAFERATGRPAHEFGTRIADATQKAKGARESASNRKEVDRLASNFAGAVGDGLYDAILEGESALDALAGIGRNLFSNMLKDSINVFEGGMKDAFKAIVGEGGTALGGLFTGLLGIGGAILSARESKANQSFSSIRSGVESSQALRGIIAGPSNIAIASVGEDLGRAVAPVVEGLRLNAKILNQIEFNTRGGRWAWVAERSTATDVPTA